MATFTVQDILNARPNLSFDGTLSGDTELVRDNEGYAVKMTGYYEFNELLAIAREVKNLNAVFAERPEESTYSVINYATGEKVISLLSYREAKDEAEKLEANSETGERFEVKADK
jgi:hypothetical protein